VGRSQVEVAGSAVLAVAGGVAWLVGSAALPAGSGTVVLAVGLAVTVWLAVRASRAGSGGARLDRTRRRRVVRLVVVGIALVALGATVLQATGRGELTVPLAVALCGALLLPVASVVERRSLIALGAALMVLGAGGAVVALNSAGRAESQGLVGLAGGVLLWVVSAQQSGLLGELRGRSRR
jgi:hypothetical protein